MAFELLDAKRTFRKVLAGTFFPPLSTVVFAAQELHRIDSVVWGLEEQTVFIRLEDREYDEDRAEDISDVLRSEGWELAPPGPMG